MTENLLKCPALSLLVIFGRFWLAKKYPCKKLYLALDNFTLKTLKNSEIFDETQNCWTFKSIPVSILKFDLFIFWNIFGMH